MKFVGIVIVALFSPQAFSGSTSLVAPQQPVVGQQATFQNGAQLVGSGNHLPVTNAPSVPLFATLNVQNGQAVRDNGHAATFVGKQSVLIQNGQGPAFVPPSIPVLLPPQTQIATAPPTVTNPGGFAPVGDTTIQNTAPVNNPASFNPGTVQ